MYDNPVMNSFDSGRKHFMSSSSPVKEISSILFDNIRLFSRILPFPIGINLSPFITALSLIPIPSIKSFTFAFLMVAVYREWECNGFGGNARPALLRFALQCSLPLSSLTNSGCSASEWVSEFNVFFCPSSLLGTGWEMTHMVVAWLDSWTNMCPRQRSLSSYFLFMVNFTNRKSMFVSSSRKDKRLSIRKDGFFPWASCP